MKVSTRFCKILQDSARFNVQEILMPKWCNTFVRQSLWPASNCCFRYRPWAKVEEGGIGLLRCLAPPESSAPGTHHALHCSGSCCRWCHRAVRCQVLGAECACRHCATAYVAVAATYSVQGWGNVLMEFFTVLNLWTSASYENTLQLYASR